MTFKSPNSMPPYRIENRCDDVFISFAQMAVARQGSEEKNMWNWLHPREGGVLHGLRLGRAGQGAPHACPGTPAALRFGA